MDQSSDRIRLSDVVGAYIKTHGYEQTLAQYELIRSQYYAQQNQLERMNQNVSNQNPQREEGKR